MPSPSASNPAQQGPWDDSPVSTSGSANDKLIERIRTRYRYMLRATQMIRDHGDLCMRALSPEGPWDPLEREARKEQKRPCIHLDQLSQYPNSLVNKVRQSPRGVKVEPGGNGADQKSAELRGDRIRAIWRESNGNQAMFTALQCAAERGYGVVTMECEEIAWDGFDQRMKIVREPDPNAVLWDPDCREADSSDMQDGFKLWRMPISDFKREYPNAEITDFNIENQAIAPDWVNLDRQTIMLARYSYIEKKRRHVYLLDDGSPRGLKVFRDELPKDVKPKDGYLEYRGQDMEILKEKDAIQKSVQQCITNGLEILDENDWAGSTIPIYPLLGKEKFVRVDGVTQRVLDSLITNAIQGQMGFDSAKTNEVETANMVPKATYLMYEGQADTNTDWENINKTPTPFAEIKAIPDGANGQILPLPTRQDFNPQIEPMEVMAESYRRAIQSAIGSHGFTITDDTNVKSAKAVGLLQQQSDVGEYHFNDNYEVVVLRLGRDMNELLDKIEDTPRDVGIYGRDGVGKTIRINEPSTGPDGQIVEHRYTPRDPKTGEALTDAAHSVVIETSADYRTQKDEAMSVVQALMAGPFGPLIADLGVGWMDLGPYGDKMKERLIPPQFKTQDGQPSIPPQVQQQLGGLQQQNQQLTQIVHQLLAAQDSHAADNASKEKIAAMNDETKKLGIAVSLREAEIAALTKGVVVHEQLTSEENMHLSEQEHDRQNAVLAHESAVGQQVVDAAAGAAQSAQDHSQGMQAAQQAQDAMTAQQPPPTDTTGAP